MVGKGERWKGTTFVLEVELITFLSEFGMVQMRFWADYSPALTTIITTYFSSYQLSSTDSIFLHVYQQG
jgi:hypothetical protein